MMLRLRVTASTVSGVLSLLTLSLCCQSLVSPHAMSPHYCHQDVTTSEPESQDQDTGSLTECIGLRSQSIDLSRGILKTSEFGELINTGAFSSSRIPEKMKTDRHFAAVVQKLNLLQTLKLSCHSFFKCVM